MVTISSVDQNPDQQIATGGTVDKLIVDHASGRENHYPQLKTLRVYMCDGSDEVVKVKGLDRLARSPHDLVSLLQEYESKGVDFIDALALSTSTPELITEDRRLIDERVLKTRASTQLGASYWPLVDTLAGKGVYGEC
ncbi:MAG: recombinase family protein [Corynebacterium sp.]|uniref:recombinase family protein n=1 Tax=Corynebacterium sp. TaxID=1720 RepID=UPI0026DC9494|nr:recombinase family protein [Corynebacterium sp.]MDO5098611.1 recombinase family protein [Corynebacterium sp.]